MQIKSLFVSSALAVGAALSLCAQGEIPTVTAPAAAAPRQFTEAQMLEMFGWFIGSNAGLAQLDLSAAEVTSVIAGLQANAKGDNPPYDMQQIGPQMGQFMETKQEKFMAGLLREELAKSKFFMDEVKKGTDVTVTPSGLVYKIMIAGDGTGLRPTRSDIVRLHYTGALVDGTVFDSTKQRNQPIQGILNDFMPGWVEGLQLAEKGSTIRLYIPPELAHGNEGNGAIPPGAALIFDLELLDINPLATATP